MVAIPFDDEFAGPSEFAHLYRALGLSPVPAGGNKQPVVAWKVLQGALTPQDTFNRWYAPGGTYIHTRMMGLLTGAASGALFIVDLDVKEGHTAMDWWWALLRTHNHGLPLNTVISKTPSGGLHIWFKAPGSWRPPTGVTAIGVDIRGEGGFTMEPPSLGYDFLPDYEPWNVDVAEAPEWLCEAIDQLPGGGGHGGRERTPSGQEFSPLGRLQDGREQFMRDLVWAVWCDLRRKNPGDQATLPLPIIQAEHDRAWAKYEMMAKSRLPPDGRSNADRLEAEGRGLTAFNDKWAAAAAQWDDKLRDAAQLPKPERPFGADAVANPDATPTPDSEVTLTPFNPWAKFNCLPFPMGVLPAPAAALVEHVSESLGVCPNATAMTLLASVCAALHHDSWVQISDSWLVRPNFWLLLNGDPGSKKTPLIDRFVKPFEEADIDSYRAFKRDYARWKEAGEDPGSKPHEPPRFLFMDATVEPIAHRLAKQTRGALVLNDEASAWLGSLEHAKGRAAIERGFYLRAYQGGFYQVDRMTRESFTVENLCLSFIGGIQPDRVHQISDLTVDGLLQRFSVVNMGPAGVSQRRLAEPELAKACRDRVTLLMGLQRQHWLFDSEAQAVSETMERMSYLLAHANQLSAGVSGWLNKLPATHAKLALALHVLATDDPLYDVEIGRWAADGAAQIMDFLISHALGFYEQNSAAHGKGGDPLNIREAASWLLTSDATRITSSDLKANVKPWRDLDRKEIVRRMSVLTGFGVVHETGSMTVPAWEIDPRWRPALDHERAVEMARKREIVARLEELRSRKSRQESQEKGDDAE